MADMLMNILFQGHVYATQHMPITYNRFDPVPAIDPSELADLTNRLSAAAVPRFKALQLQLGGTVLQGPTFWTSTFLKSALACQRKGLDVPIEVPNGCCTTAECPVKVYYGIVRDLLVSPSANQPDPA